MIKINVLIRDQNWKKYIKKPEVYLKNKIKSLNKKDKFFKNRNVNFTLLLSDNKEIRKINKKFRKKNNATDVLSFPFYEKKELKRLFKKKSSFYLGDIVISLNKIINNSNNNKNFQIKFDKLWLHGLVHLLGHRHKFDKDYLKMKRVENRFFNSIK